MCLPNVTAGQQVQVHSVSVYLGKQQGSIDPERGIVGRLTPPIRRPPREYNGEWTFTSPQR